MPVYNAGKYLRLAVLSLVNQSFTDWELLLIDDGSTDDAVQSIADIDDARIRILRDGSNRGLAARLNEAIDQARGVYFARMDQDDVSYPERFARQVAMLQANAEIDLLATRAITIDEDNVATGLFPGAMSHAQICARPWRGFHFPHPTWMGRTAWFRKFHYTVPGPYFCEDQELLLRSYRSSRFCTVDAVLFAYRIRSRIDLRKQAKTFRTLLAAQWQLFISTGRWHLALLAVMVYLARVTRDRFVNSQSERAANARRDKLPQALLTQWDAVLAQSAPNPVTS